MTPDPVRGRLDVIGRDGELSSIDAFIDGLVDGPRALVLEGEAGIGKTTLWQHGVIVARERGWRTLTVRPGESEATLSFAGLADLMKDVDDVLDELPEPQRHALEVALLRADPIGPPPEPRAVFAAVLEVFRGVAAHGPVLLALDDVQWLDRSTRDALEFAIRRFDDEPIGPLIAVRAEGSTLPLGVSRSLPEDRVTRVRVDALAPDALHDLLRARLDVTFPPFTFRRLYEMSGGNPFFAIEIARASMRGDRRATGMALPVPKSLREDLVRSRVDALPSQAREMLLYASAASRPTVSLLEAAIGRSPIAPQLEKATHAGIVQVDEDVLAFAHPLYGSAIYADASREHRHRVHRRLADVVESEEERARHLALAADGPDVQVAAELEAAARLARQRGVPTAAGELYELAERLAPPDEVAYIRRLQIDRADCWFLAGDKESAESLLESARRMVASGRERAEVLWRLARLCHYEDARRAVGLSLEALDQEGLPPQLSSQIRTQLTWALAAVGDLLGAERQAEDALGEAEQTGEPALVVEALDASACVRGWRGDGTAYELLQRGEQIARSDNRLPGHIDPRRPLAMLLEEAGELDEARRIFRSLLDGAAERGDDVSPAQILSDLADTEWRAGNWATALANLTELERLAPGAIRLCSHRALVRASQGEVENAVADAERALGLAETSGLVGSQIVALHSLGHLELSLGDAGRAHARLARAWEIFRGAGFDDPGTFPFVPDLVEALVDLGRLDEAEPIVAWLEERGRTLDRAYALAVGARCRGLLLAARGDLRGGIASVEEALTHHERVPMPFELARTYLVLGAIRRRGKQKRSAREALERALQIFGELGARLWVERTRGELARIGGRRAVVGELTEAERRVATLAAAGRTNREIADTLFTSVRTVEGHLSHVYGKLGVRSRTELAVFLDEPDGSSHA